MVYQVGLDKARFPEIAAAEQPINDAFAACVTALSDGHQTEADDLATAVEATAKGHAMFLLDGDFGSGPRGRGRGGRPGRPRHPGPDRGPPGAPPVRSRSRRSGRIPRDRTDFAKALSAWHSRASVQKVGGTDALLAARLAAGDDQALEEAFDLLAPAVYGAALYVLGQGSAAQDVVQDVFVELWSHPDRYDPAIARLRTYLTVLARHRAVDLVRSELRRVARQERHYRLTPSRPNPSPHDQVADAEAASVVRDAVQLLPDEQRHVVELAYFGA